jgi:4a-hydroxytetrahydrobiopterin dehydratase
MSSPHEHSCPLAGQKCTPCKQGGIPLSQTQIQPLISQISEYWQVMDERYLKRDFKFKNFIDALDFVNDVGHLAESQQHHPDIYLKWGKVSITLFTHKIGGLHQNDFILAAGIDKLYLCR